MSEVETARMVLRPWQPDDLAELTRLLTDPVQSFAVVGECCGYDPAA